MNLRLKYNNFSIENVRIWCKFVYEDFPLFLVINKKKFLNERSKIKTVLIDIIKRKFKDDTYKFNMDIKLIKMLLTTTNTSFLVREEAILKWPYYTMHKDRVLPFLVANGTFPHILVYVCRSKFTKR